MTIGDLNSQFAGRKPARMNAEIDRAVYNPDALYHIHRRNRAYAWTRDMQEKLIDSLLKGYPVPPIYCLHTIDAPIPGGPIQERNDIMDGGQRTTTFRLILNETVRELTAEERLIISGRTISVIIMRNASAEDQRTMFRRLNKSVKVTDGQLYTMSEDDSPLVREATAFLNDDDYPLRALITRHFFDTRNADNAGKKNLENAVALISGALQPGVGFITKSFNVQEQHVNRQEPIDRGLVCRILSQLFGIFTLADEIEPLADKRKKRGQWSVGKWLGVMLYDLKTNVGLEPYAVLRVQEKWAAYLTRVRRGEARAEDAAKLAGAQNLTATRYRRISTKVAIYLAEDRIATDEELKQIPEEDSEQSELSDEESDA
jgi:hypothetical protein